MLTEDLLQPLSENDPCGPDLLAMDDAEYLTYYFNIESRIPQSFFNLAQNTQFDRSTIRLASEYQSVRALLNRSRDLRLIVIAAQFEMLAGDFAAFVGTVELAAGLIRAYPGQVHPIGPEDRRDSLAELDSLQAVIIPLEELEIVNDRRAGPVTLRDWMVATGLAQNRAERAPQDLDTIADAVSRSENAGRVESFRAGAQRLQAALKSVEETCREHGLVQIRLERLADRLDYIKRMLATAKPDVALQDGTLLADSPDAAPSNLAPAARGPFASANPVHFPAILNHRAAFDHLFAAETYLLRFEPSALALVLIVQARQLVGRPMVEALDVLLGETANRARIEFGSDSGFALKMPQIRLLSTTAETSTRPDWSEDVQPLPSLENRVQLGQCLKNIEDFFLTHEPTSPIPLFLARARASLGKDFQTILRDLFPKE